MSQEKLKLAAHMTPQEMEEAKKRSKTCHRAFYCQAMLVDVPAEQPTAGIMTPHGPVPVEQSMRQVMSVNAGFWLCQRELCALWDKRHERCLDASVAIATAYGKKPPLSVDGSDT